MPQVAMDLLKHSMLLFLLCLAFLVLRDMLLSKQSFKSLVATHKNRRINPERVALLYLTLAFALYYTLTTLTTPLSELEIVVEDQKPGEVIYSLPDVPIEILVALGGTQISYILGKFLRLDILSKLIRSFREISNA